MGSTIVGNVWNHWCPVQSE